MRTELTTPIKIGIPGIGTIESADLYLKSEADEVIAEKDKEIMELKGQVNGFKNRSNLWHYNAVEEHKKFVQVDQQITDLKEKHKKEVGQLLMKIAGLEKLVETADKLVKQKGGFTVKDITFNGVKLEGLEKEA